VTIDAYGNASEFSGVLDVGVAEEETEARVSGPRLFRIAPNPLDRQTIITYVVPTTCRVHLGVYDATGRLVEELVDAESTPGVYRIQLSARDLSGGVYFCNLRTESMTEVRKIVVLH
jgi:hypothetical protein